MGFAKLRGYVGVESAWKVLGKFEGMGVESACKVRGYGRGEVRGKCVESAWKVRGKFEGMGVESAC